MKIKLTKVDDGNRKYWAKYRTEDDAFTVEQHDYTAPVRSTSWFIYKTADKAPLAKYSGVEVATLSEAREYLSDLYTHSALAMFKGRANL